MLLRTWSKIKISSEFFPCRAPALRLWHPHCYLPWPLSLICAAIMHTLKSGLYTASVLSICRAPACLPQTPKIEPPPLPPSPNTFDTVKPHTLILLQTFSDRPNISHHATCRVPVHRRRHLRCCPPGALSLHGASSAWPRMLSAEQSGWPRERHHCW